MKKYVVEIDAVRHNLETLVKKADGTPIWAVVKGNGYGLGVGFLAPLCLEAGITRFAVTEVSEAEAIRALNRENVEILMLRPTTAPEELTRLLQLRVILTVGSAEDAVALNSVAERMDCMAEAHVKVDTGMGRYGFLPDELDKILSVYRYNDHIAVTGIYTHLHSAFSKAKFTMEQVERFQQVLKNIGAAGVERGMAHCCNSEGFLRYPEYKMDAVRLGSALLGRVRAKSSLRRVGWCEATVDEIRWLPAGHTTGYGAAWKAKRPTQIGVIPVGWYHGFTNEYGNDIFRFRDCLRQALGAIRRMIFKKRIYVSVNGKRCPVLGHVGMLHTVCQVEKVPCKTGDPVVLEINPLQVRGMEIEYR